MQNREYQHDDKDERHRGQQEIAGFDRQAGGIGRGSRPGGIGGTDNDIVPSSCILIAPPKTDISRTFGLLAEKSGTKQLADAQHRQ
jgi:hypothetical protein